MLASEMSSTSNGLVQNITVSQTIAPDEVQYWRFGVKSREGFLEST